MGWIEGVGSEESDGTGFLACMVALARAMAMRVSREGPRGAAGDDGGEDESCCGSGDLGRDCVRRRENGVVVWLVVTLNMAS